MTLVTMSNNAQSYVTVVSDSPILWGVLVNRL